MNNDIYVRDWMSQCPIVQDQTAARNRVKLLEYGIYPAVVQPSYHENVLGELVADDIQEASFVLTAKIQYLDKNVQRYNFYQKVVEWIEEQNKYKRFPKLNEGVVRSASARISQYVSEPNNEMERNEIEIRFSYKRYN